MILKIPEINWVIMEKNPLSGCRDLKSLYLLVYDDIIGEA